MKQRELLQETAKKELFKAQAKFHEEKRKYNDAVRNYYKTLEKISADYPIGNDLYEILIKARLRENNIEDCEIKNYNDTKVFSHIVSNIKSFVNIKEERKEMFALINPDSISKLSAVMAASKNNYLLKKIAENTKKPDYIHKTIRPIIKDTYGVIVFREQVDKILNLILDTNEYEIDLFYETLNRLCKLKNLSEIDSAISLIDYIKEFYCEIYVEQYKTPYFAFVSSAIEKGIKEAKAKKLFNLLLAYFLNQGEQYKKEKELHSRELYKLAFIDMNYPKNR